MLKKKVTVLLLPQDPRCVRRYTITRAAPWLTVLLCLIVFAALSVFSIRTHLENRSLAGQLDELQRLRQKSAEQNVQIYAFADKIRLLEQEMGQLRQNDRKLRAMTGEAPHTAQTTLSGVGGSDASLSDPKERLKAGAEQLIRQMHRDLDSLLLEASVQEQSQQELSRIFEDSKSIMASTPSAWPLRGEITSTFGYRASPFGGRREFHRGLDIRAPQGTPIRASADGMVVAVERTSGYGIIVAVNHGYGLVTRYAHVAKSYVEPGQRVRRGDRIAAVGTTGRTTGPHLHYEVIVNGIPVNPMRFLAARK